MWRVGWKILLLLIVVMGLFYFFNDGVSVNEPLESPVQHGNAIAVPGLEQLPEAAGAPRPDTGLSVFVGKKEESLLKQFGEPDRIEPSSYGYDWWVYTSNDQFMAGVRKGKINQIYTSSTDADVAPFAINQDVQEIHRFNPIESEIDVQLDENIYSFSLNSDDVRNRILIQYDGLLAQLYIDEVDGKLEGVRFIAPLTIIKHQPYDMTYLGEMVEAPKPSSNVQAEVDRAMERQIFELTNQLRNKHDLKDLQFSERLTAISWEHSKEMVFQKYAPQETDIPESFAERLKAANLAAKKAGENTAINYVDAIEAVHGWLNSPKHRGVLLNEQFTHTGAGVYGKFYTQSFVRLEQAQE